MARYRMGQGGGIESKSSSRFATVGSGCRTFALAMSSAIDPRPEVKNGAGSEERPLSVRLPKRGEYRIAGAGRGLVWSFRHGSNRVIVRRAKAVAGAHDFLRMPSCQINFSIDGLALGVATAIVDRT